MGAPSKRIYRRFINYSIRSVSYFINIKYLKNIKLNNLIFQSKRLQSASCNPIKQQTFMHFKKQSKEVTEVRY